MKLFKYKDFIKENIDSDENLEYWLNNEDMQKLFEPFRDDEYVVKYIKSFFNKDMEFVYPNGNEKINIGENIYLGWRIHIEKSNYAREDLTNDFNSIIRELELDGHSYFIEDNEGKIDKENIYFRKGSIIIWLPEKKGKPLPSKEELKNTEEYFDDGDTYESKSELFLFIYQYPLKIKNQKVLAEVCQWQNYKVTDNNKIYFEIEAGDLGDILLSRNSHYKDMIRDGIDCSHYYTDYLPDISSIFTYHLTKEQEKNIAKYVLKNIDLDDLIEDVKWSSDTDLTNKSEEEIIDFLVNGKTNALEHLCKDHDFELIEELQRVLLDHELQAQCEANEKELYTEFDRKLEREGIDCQREESLIKRFYYTEDPETGLREKKSYDEYGWIYKVFFNQEWIEDYDYGMFIGENLESLFKEFCGEAYLEFDLNPYYSDYGSIDDKYLESDFNEKIKEFS